MRHDIDGFPFFLVKEDATRNLRTLPADHGEGEDPPSDQHVKHDGRLEAINVFDLQFFDLAARFENSEKDFNLPSA